MPGHIHYSEQELSYIKAHSKLPRKQLHQQFVAKFNRPEISKMNLASLCKRNGWLTGRNGQFKKGQQSWNKGKTGYMGANKTSFKKGQQPHNTKPLYTERINVEGYIEIKVPETNPHTGAKTRYRLKHRWVYEQHHGPIAKNETITFIDNNPHNCAPENLLKISRAQALEMNRQGLQKHTGLAKKTAATLAQLSVAANQQTKRLAGKKA